MGRVNSGFSQDLMNVVNTINPVSSVDINQGFNSWQTRVENEKKAKSIKYTGYIGLPNYSVNSERESVGYAVKGDGRVYIFFPANYADYKGRVPKKYVSIPSVNFPKNLTKSSFEAFKSELAAEAEKFRRGNHKGVAEYIYENSGARVAHNQIPNYDSQQNAGVTSNW
jgi:hypothetical protein